MKAISSGEKNHNFMDIGLVTWDYGIYSHARKIFHFFWKQFYAILLYYENGILL